MIILHQTVPNNTPDPKSEIFQGTFGRSRAESSTKIWSDLGHLGTFFFDVGANHKLLFRGDDQKSKR